VNFARPKQSGVHFSLAKEGTLVPFPLKTLIGLTDRL
jgi:hypothetical protein